MSNISTDPNTAIWSIQPGNFEDIDACESVSGCLVRPAFVDIDNNGTYDLFIRSNDIFYFYRNEGTLSDPEMVLEEDYFNMLPDFYQMLHFADTDVDGKLEMYVPTSEGNIVVYENEGIPSEPDWHFQTDDYLGFTSTYSKCLAFGDVNFDSFPDVFVGHYTNPMFDPKMMLFLSTDSGFVYHPIPFLENYGYGARAVPELVDLDGDGFLELVVANSTDTLLHFEATDSTGLNWQDITASSSLPISLLFHKISFGDIDFDGDMDMVGKSKFFENIGTNTNPEFIERNWHGAIFGGLPTLVDLTDDCGLEVFSGLRFYKYRGIKPEIQAYSYDNYCSGEPPVQLSALPTGAEWVLGTNDQGVFNPDTIPGYYAIICSYSAPEGCYQRFDTVWASVNWSPDATITEVSGNPILEDTIDICPAAGIQTLTTAQGGGYFTGLNMGSPQFNPATWSMGYHTVTYYIYQSGCWDRDTLVINVVNPPYVIIAGNTSICLGNSTTLSATGGYSYEWDHGAMDGSISVSPLETTTYTVTVTGEGIGCTDTESVTVIVHPLPAVMLSGPDEICLGSGGTLLATGGITYLWNDASTGNILYITPPETTTYSVTITDEYGCNNWDSMTIVVNPLPTAEITGDSEICSGESATLFATGGISYEWSTGAMGSSIIVTPIGSTMYFVTVTDSNDCQDADSLLVWVNDLPDASIASINGAPLVGDTIVVCDTAGIQQLEPITPGGEFSGISPDGTFDPLLLGEGSHLVTYTVTQDDCTASSTITIIVITCTVGVREEHVQEALQLRVRPNPFSNEVTFEMEIQEAGTMRLIITDLTGRAIETLLDEVTLQAGNHVFTSYKAGLIANGAYIIRGWINGQAFSSLIIKQ